ncbi:MAG: F0F1 ATP synthase subunit gamma [Alphaproteobacteria bacterium]|jgi:F-type H+-transporting ATPase subunit gamma|nr:F0F1 ATP synthase subunit gamma [Rhodospirillaceae bacterium]MBT6511141.1 F0F1 ATP synthase subunit gamma [Rhodospirillaceae bacterium]MBT7615168.1 F0F1 ATP synthase subunit gamma [Rhodospirillaceae bacterium]MBT7647140.1 F0F1 ATP synthase subunit gamma [Rhodospirillaceae bacterium]MDG2481629.1 F0F1 ATP synthase subunit gamma [Alphaproteobacteria bacterium]
MANLKALRIRINSVRSTRKITSAMKMVAAAKLRRAQESAESARPYAERMARMMGSLASAFAGREDAPALLAGNGKQDVHLLVIVSSNRGLCGSFNVGVMRAVRARIAELRDEGKEVKLLCVGRKARDLLRRDFGSAIVDTITDLDKNFSYQSITQISERVTELFEQGEFDVCSMVYNKFQSVMTQVVTWQGLIPAMADDDASESEDDGLNGAVHIFEPDENEILEHLLPQNLGIQLFRGILESQASEHAARMTAMDNASRNAGDMIDRLNTLYNRTRQAAITTEITEIVSGAEAL